ncbi:MAG: hypothetical protein ACI9A2_003986 [Halioglobus sp.]|jgi:hypothetical protein
MLMPSGSIDEEGISVATLPWFQEIFDSLESDDCGAMTARVMTIHIDPIVALPNYRNWFSRIGRVMFYPLILAYN